MLDFKRVGWSVSLLLVLIHVIMLARISGLGGEPRVLADHLIAIGHPGYQAMAPPSIAIVLVEAFVFGWIASLIFVGVYNGLGQEKK